MKNFILKYKNIIIIASIALAFLIGLGLISQTKSTKQTADPSRQKEVEKIKEDYVPPEYAQLPPEENLDSEKVKESVASKKKLSSDLPIYITDFKISNGMKTTLNVYTIEGDPEYIIHIEIYGVNYEEQNPDPAKNPNITAFVESFREIKRQLSNKGVDLSKIYFVFGAREYIQKTAELWIKTFNLL